MIKNIGEKYHGTKITGLPSGGCVSLVSSTVYHTMMITANSMQQQKNKAITAALVEYK